MDLPTHGRIEHTDRSVQVPINAVLVFGSLTAVIALVFDIETLVEFLSIGTLLAYSIVSACVIILRYQPARYPEDGSFDNGMPLLAHIITGQEPQHRRPGWSWQKTNVLRICLQPRAAV